MSNELNLNYSFVFIENLKLDYLKFVILTLCLSASVIPLFEMWQILPNSDEYSEGERVRWAVLLGRYPAKE